MFTTSLFAGGGLAIVPTSNLILQSTLHACSQTIDDEELEDSTDRRELELIINFVFIIMKSNFVNEKFGGHLI